MGGGVLNNGSSDKDLDLYFLPLDDRPGSAEQMRMWLQDLWGLSSPIGGDNYPPNKTFAFRETFIVDGRRIDVFIH